MTVIKICGITSLRDALAAVEAGADCLGFNFYMHSPRHINVTECEKITAVLNRDFPSILKVGVFVNAPAFYIRALMQTCSLDLAQLHGDEGPEVLSQLGSRAFKAFRGIPSDMAGLTRVDPPACLIDASVKGAYGGTGVTADWGAAARLAEAMPVFLAGGLKPENTADAIRRVKPWGVDTASGVEARPGMKDAAKMVDFVQAVREVDSRRLKADAVGVNTVNFEIPLAEYGWRPTG
ncbi:MAG: phosphoribosylanthranilate isomerase [Chloroflexi bacterium]|nr:phosphoribosylanthranilate isomerase [Chloroflexota bacterium]BCY16993.1 N-(5'-phosphoribosyl)anthranilate isomerase [Leptolinea sp. HRD-7]